MGKKDFPDELLAYVPRAKAVADEITDYIRG